MFIRQVSIEQDRFPTRRVYPFNVPAIQQTAELHLERPVTFFVGENGSGKSTLLDAVARSCGIHIWTKPKRHLAHENPHEATLHSTSAPAGRTAGCRALFSAQRPFATWRIFWTTWRCATPAGWPTTAAGCSTRSPTARGFCRISAAGCEFRGFTFSTNPKRRSRPGTNCAL